MCRHRFLMTTLTFYHRLLMCRYRFLAATFIRCHRFLMTTLIFCHRLLMCRHRFLVTTLIFCHRLLMCRHRFFVTTLICCHRFLMTTYIGTRDIFVSLVNGIGSFIAGTHHGMNAVPNSNGGNDGCHGGGSRSDSRNPCQAQGGLLKSYGGLLKSYGGNFEFVHRIFLAFDRGLSRLIDKETRLVKDFPAVTGRRCPGLPA